MVLAEIWLEHRRRKFRAKAFDRTFALARAEGCDEGFPETWQRAYALGHKITYAMGYDKGRSEGFAVGYAESPGNQRTTLEALAAPAKTRRGQ